MKILMLHNYYQYSGGEDQSFFLESALLEERGHQVVRYVQHNDSIKQMKAPTVAAATLWNHSVYKEVRSLIKNERPDILHCQNIFPLISPAAYYAARAENVPVVQSLRNYRLLCSNALLFRDGRVCEACLGKAIPWPGVRYGCYRESRPATTVVATMLALHHFIGTWSRMVNVYVVLTEFVRRKYIEGGLPAEKIVVKPNFISPDPGIGDNKGKYALFVGRLSAEKGVDTLLAAWRNLRLPLKIVGKGPMSSTIMAEYVESQYVEWLGLKSVSEVLEMMGEAAFLVLPSKWYEGFPRVIVEAYAKGLPVLASNVGSMTTLIEHGRTGLHFTPGDPDDLRAKMQWAWSHPGEMQQMGLAARREYEKKYTAGHSYQLLMEIYEKAQSHTRQSATR